MFDACELVLMTKVESGTRSSPAPYRQAAMSVGRMVRACVCVLKSIVRCIRQPLSCRCRSSGVGEVCLSVSDVTA